MLDGSCFNLMHKFSWTIESFQTQLLYYLDRVRIRNRLIVHVEVGVKQIGGSKEVPHAREASYWVEPCLGDLRNSSKLKVVKQIEEFFLVIRRCMPKLFQLLIKQTNKQTRRKQWRTHKERLFALSPSSTIEPIASLDSWWWTLSLSQRSKGLQDCYTLGITCIKGVCWKWV